MYDDAPQPESQQPRENQSDPAPLSPEPGEAPTLVNAPMSFEHPHENPYAWYEERQRQMAAQAAHRAAMLRRLRVVLGVALAAFCLVTFLLVRSESPLGEWLGISGPSRVVRQHLAALNRGETRQAYSFFSENYRGKIPWRAYEELVSSHRSMFRTQLLSMDAPSHTSEQAVLDTRLASSSGAVYIARFTLIHVDGHWLIDQVRWSLAPDPRSFTRT